MKNTKYIIPATVITAAREARAATNYARWHSTPEEIADTKAAQEATMAPITTAINLAEGRARTRCLTADDLLNVLERVENRLGISPNAMQGVTIHADVNAQHFPRSYNGYPQSTQIWARYTSRGWAISEIKRNRVSSPGTAIKIELTDAARAAVMRRAQYISV